MAKDRLLFLKQFIQRQSQIGAFLPSTQALGDAMARMIPEHSHPLRILEVGPGTGAITEQIVKKLKKDDELVLVEMNPEFCNHLRKRIPFWTATPESTAITLHKADILDFNSGQNSSENFDHILCSLPLNNHSREFLEELFTKFKQLLTEEGTLSYYEYWMLRGMGSKIGPSSHRNRLRTLNGFFEERVLPHVVARETIVWNLPPAAVFHLRLK